jgi:hypothetical protein
MCFGVGPSGLPIPKSTISSPRRRAVIFNWSVMLKIYGGSRLMRSNSVMVVLWRVIENASLAAMPFCDDAKTNIVTNLCPNGNVEGFNIMLYGFLSENFTRRRGAHGEKNAFPFKSLPPKCL